MRRVALIIWLPLAGILAGCPVFPGWTPVAPESRVEKSTGTKYWIYVPSEHNKEERWPLVITLHGSWGWDGRRRQAMEWKALAEKHSFIVVAPKSRSSEGILPTFRWQKKLEEDERNILAVLEEVVQQYNIDRSYVMLTGFSAGGYPMYWIGLRNPDKFHMLVARACNSSVKMLEKIQVTKEVRKMPIFLFWGKDDLRPIQKQSWAAFRWLRLHKCYATTKKEIRGGHMRRPEVAYHAWEPYLRKRAEKIQKRREKDKRRKKNRRKEQ